VPQTPPSPPVDTWIINLIEGAQLKSFDLSKLSGVKLADAQLASDFSRALAALAAARGQDKKPVSIRFTGKGERRIRLGYVVESPVWKTSYRLVLGDKDAKIQGWAIVENQTDNDWKNVQLSLVSGRPISFEMELYQPIYLERPTVELNLFKNLRPQMYAGGMNENAAPVRKSMERQAQTLRGGVNGRFGAAFGGDGAKSMASEVAAAPAAPMDMTSSVQPLASGMKLGELFHFTVGDVTLPRQSSAMIPIVGDSIGCERVSIYNSNVMPRNALNGVMLDNTTGKHLLQGPVTVYTDGGYAGDATIDNLPPGQKRMLSYGVDLEMLIDPKPEAKNTLITGKIVKGVLMASRRFVQTVKYAVESKSDRDKTLIIEQPIIQTWSLTDTPDPMEKTDQLYRFKVAVPKGGHASLTVNQQSVQDQEIALLDSNEDVLLSWSRQGELPAKVRDALIEAAKRKQAVADLETQINQKKQELSGISTEQGRLRENMRTVDKGSQYYNRLMTKLNDQETQIEKLQSDRDDLENKANVARAAFQNYLNDLNVQ